MNTPSIKTLRPLFNENAKRAKAVLTAGPRTLEGFPECQPRILECYRFPLAWDLRMHALNDLGGFYGVECAETSNGYGRAHYLNAGDTYTPTVILWKGRYRVQSIGDFVETLERRGVRFN